MADRYSHERDRYGRDDRGMTDRAADEVRSWFGNDEAARRRRMDDAERERWETEGRNRTMARSGERWRSGSYWGDEHTYSTDRPYGDRPPSPRPRSWGYGEAATPGSEYGRMGGFRDYPRDERVTYPKYGRESYTGPYGRERYGAREWSSTEGWRVPGPYAGRGPKGYQRSDERIRDEVNERLTAHGLIDASEVDCRVQNGEVVLTGFVDSRAAKRAAEDLAEDVYGVREVHNQLRVRSHASDEGVGRTSVLGITESQMQTKHRP